ncbi:unnamed protein product [Lampetra planeri]
MATTMQLGRVLQQAARRGLLRGAVRAGPGAAQQRAGALLTPWWQRGLVTAGRPLLVTHADKVSSRPQARPDVGNARPGPQLDDINDGFQAKIDDIEELVGKPAWAEESALGSASQPLEGPEGVVSVPYEELKALLAASAVWLVDVREPSELKENGTIEGCVNVPLGELGEALQLSPREFRAHYGSELAAPNAPNTVFLCRAGRRSKEALVIAQKLGYTRARHYGGGWLDWERREQQA